MYRYPVNKFYNITVNMTNNIFYYLEDKFIEFYKSLLIQPIEEIEMTKINENNIIITQPTKLKIN